VVFTATLMFYNTGLQQYHGMAVNWHGKCFITLAPGGRKWQLKKLFVSKTLKHLDNVY
jgi:hypothetical protein